MISRLLADVGPSDGSIKKKMVYGLTFSSDQAELRSFPAAPEPDRIGLIVGMAFLGLFICACASVIVIVKCKQRA